MDAPWTREGCWLVLLQLRHLMGGRGQALLPSCLTAPQPPPRLPQLLEIRGHPWCGRGQLDSPCPGQMPHLTPGPFLIGHPPAQVTVDWLQVERQD